MKTQLGFGRQCPWCCEPISRASRHDRTCPLCHHELFSDDGSELRELDLRYDRVRQAQEERFHRLLGIGTAITLAVGLLVPLTHLGATLVIPMMVLGHLLTIRLFLIRDAWKYLSPSRRFFSRWILRLSFVWIGGPGYGMAIIPFAGAAVAGGVFALLTWLAHNYVLSSLAREKDRRPSASWEKVTLGCLGILTVAAIVVVVIVMAALGWSISQITEWIGP